MRVDFYTGTTNRLLVACRLCAKATQQGLKVIVYIPEEGLMNQFDKLLWTFSATSFVPHCRSHDELAAVTPVILDSQPKTQVMSNFDVLFNLSSEILSELEHVKRVIEIIDEMEDSKQLARQRYRYYQELGYVIHHHRLTEN